MEILLSSEAHANSYQAVLLAEHAGWPNVPGPPRNGLSARRGGEPRPAAARSGSSAELGFILSSAERKGRGRPPIVEPIIVPQQPRAPDHAQGGIAQPGPRAGKVVARSVTAREALHLGGACAAYGAVGPQGGRRVTWHA